MKIQWNQVHESDWSITKSQMDARCYDDDGDMNREFAGMQEAREGYGNRDLHHLCVQGKGLSMKLKLQPKHRTESLLTPIGPGEAQPGNTQE